MKPRQRLLLNLQKFHLKRIQPESDFIYTEKVSRVLIGLNKKIQRIRK